MQKYQIFTMSRRRYRTIIGVASFFDETTGACQKIEGTCWYKKNFNNVPGYFLKIHNTFKEFPDDCYLNTTNKPGGKDA